MLVLRTESGFTLSERTPIPPEKMQYSILLLNMLHKVKPKIWLIDISAADGILSSPYQESSTKA